MFFLNPLEHPICLADPLRLTPSAWAAHVPFAMFLVDALRPRTVVELGTHTGVSYCAFCQAVKTLKVEARCYAIDTWEGDDQAGFYGPEVLADLRAHHDPLYGSFSSLVRSTFADALPRFEDGTIDLLHIDGYHSYEAVSRDFENWLPKMSSRGVVILHDTDERLPGFGVWKFWEEIKPRYPHFEFKHEHGLGLVATGSAPPDGIRRLLAATDAEASLLRDFFRQVGQRLRVSLDYEQQGNVLRSLSGQSSGGAQLIQSLSNQLAISEEVIQSLSSQLSAKEAHLHSILNSRAWRWVERYGLAKAKLLRLYKPLSPRRKG